MAVCRKARCIKLTIITIILLTIIYSLYPEQIRNVLSQFAPPKEVRQSEIDDDQEVESVHQEEPRHKEVMIRQHQRHGESETYLTPGNPGNFEPMREEEGEGPGEHGAAHHTKHAGGRLDELVNDYGMNMMASDEISLDRSLPDTRLSECKYWHYPSDLPKASVVIVFHNEGRSVLLRTIHSVINRTPGQFLEEILLVDDFSDKSDLGSSLESYIKIFRGQVRLVRNKERQGLIRSRNRGAEEARGVVVVFLDAHCEVNKNWLPPLLAPIYRNYTTMTVPIIDGVDHNTFEYRPVYQAEEHFRGIFEWGMLYKETELGESEARKRAHHSEPYPSPTHAGGLFAINRQYFLSLGAYDPGLLVWGGENFELSFKIWQCGGSIVWVPCSRVGHVYRSFMPYGFGTLTDKVKGPIITVNYKRVVEVWMDEEYKEHFYTREPTARYVDMGNITAQLELKKRLECKSFDWFMKNVAYDVLEKYPRLPANQELGALVNTGSRLCLDTLGRVAPAMIGLAPCTGQGDGQQFRLNTEGQLGVGERCIEATPAGARLIFCPSGKVSGPWSYDGHERSLRHTTARRCLAVRGDTTTLELCQQGDQQQQWTFRQTKPHWAQ